MIDPKNITNFKRTRAKLEEFLLFAICVAGKNAHQQAAKLDKFLKGFREKELTPFEKLGTLWGSMDIYQRLEWVKMGQYKRISQAFYFASQIRNLDEVDVADLQMVKGIGPKTARFFLMHSRPNVQLACLDTHILKWLAAQGVEDVPKSTPSGLRYLQLEIKFLEFCGKLGKSPAELDLEIWKRYAQVNKTN